MCLQSSEEIWYTEAASLHLLKLQISDRALPVSILILAGGICFLVPNGDSSSNYPTRIPLCESLLMPFWNVVEDVLRELDECGGVDDERYVTQQHLVSRAAQWLLLHRPHMAAGISEVSFYTCSYYPQKWGFYRLSDYLCIEKCTAAG